MIFSYLVLFAILLATPALWFRWWHFNRFTAYAWGMMVFMACFGIVYLGFGEADWARTVGLFALIFIMTVAKHMHAKKRAIERQQLEAAASDADANASSENHR